MSFRDSTDITTVPVLEIQHDREKGLTFMCDCGFKDVIYTVLLSIFPLTYSKRSYYIKTFNTFSTFLVL